MRAQLLVASIFASGVVLLGVACGTETIYVYEDAGAAPSSSSSGRTSSSSTGGVGDDDDDDDDDDAGSTSGNPPKPFVPDIASTKVVDRNDIVPLNLAGDDLLYQVAKAPAPKDIFAVPIGGGTPVKLFTRVDGDAISINGGAIAHWTNVVKGVGTLEVWTRATGLKTALSTSSLTSYFRATADGSKIAFSTNAVLGADDKPASTEMAIRNTADATDIAKLSGANNTLNLVASAAPNKCPARFTFATGTKNFIAQFCEGVLPTAVRARMLVLRDGQTTFDRVDGTNENSAATLLGSAGFSVDTTGLKIAAVAFNDTAATVYTLGGATVAKQEIAKNVSDVVGFLPNGNTLLYRTSTPPADPDGGAPTVTLFKSAITAPAPKKLGDGVAFVSSINPDGTRIVYSTARTAQGLGDLHILDISQDTPQTPVDLLTTQKGASAGFTTDGSKYVFVDGTTATGKVRAVTMASGQTADVAVGVGARLAGSGAVVFYDVKQEGSNVFLSIGFADLAGGGRKGISDAMPNGEFYVRGNKLAYLRAKQNDYAIYGLTLP